MPVVWCVPRPMKTRPAGMISLSLHLSGINDLRIWVSILRFSDGLRHSLVTIWKKKKGSIFYGTKYIDHELTLFGANKSWIWTVAGKLFLRIRLIWLWKSSSIFNVAWTPTWIKLIDGPLVMENFCFVCTNELRLSMLEIESQLYVDNSLIGEIFFFFLLTWNADKSLILMLSSLICFENESTT